MNEARVQAIAEHYRLFPNTTLPEICLGLRAGVNGSADPIPLPDVVAITRMLQMRLNTWVDGLVNERAIDDAVRNMVAATVQLAQRYLASLHRCLVYRLRLTQHPCSEKLRVGQLGPHQVVIGDHYKDGVLGVFLPEGVIVPDKLAEEMWVKGKLAGKKKNRVRARVFDGVHSEGLFYGSQYYVLGQCIKGPSWNSSWQEGQDVTEELGVTEKDA